jgi:hypothetical protein
MWLEPSRLAIGVGGAVPVEGWEEFGGSWGAALAALGGLAGLAAVLRMCWLLDPRPAAGCARRRDLLRRAGARHHQPREP